MQFMCYLILEGALVNAICCRIIFKNSVYMYSTWLLTQSDTNGDVDKGAFNLDLNYIFVRL